MTDVNEFACVWNGMRILRAATAKMSRQYLDVNGTARLLHVPVPPIIRSRDSVGLLLVDHILACIMKERELTGGCLVP